MEKIFTIENVISVFADIVTVLAIWMFMSIFFDKLKSRTFLIITYSAYLVFNRIVVTQDRPLVLMFINLFFFFMITCNYKSKLRMRITASIFLYVILMMVEIILVSSIKIAGNNFTSSNKIIFSFLANVCSFFFIMILKNMNMIKNGSDVPIKLWLAVCVIPIGSVMITVFISLCCSFKIILITTFFVLSVNIMVFDLYDDLVKQFNQSIRVKVVEQQNKYYEKQLEIMLKTQENLRKYRHDSKTRMLVLQAVLHQGDLRKLEEYITKMNSDLDYKNMFITTGNLTVDAVLNYKIEKATDSKVKITTDLCIPQEMNIDSMDLALILSNLLDNATTAVTLIEEESRIVDLRMKYDKGILSIHVENLFNTPVHYFNGKYFTTKKDSDNHGFGLEAVKHTTSKYNGCVDIQHTHNVFIVDVLLYEKAELESAKIV